MRVLLVEDDRKAARLLTKGLQEEGFIIDVAHSGEEGDEAATVTDYDVIVLDWLLPGKDGMAVCRDLRARGISTPILMLTAKDAVKDRVSGLNAGADDYLTKPFVFAELIARIHALLRRSELTRPVILRVADLAVDPLSHRVTRAGIALSLTPKEYAILEMLMRHTGELVSRSRLAEGVWADEGGVLDNLVDVHVSRLRKKVDTSGTQPLIHTVRSRGYLLAPNPL
jgi:DNA-binding response OmpR family regulator